MGKNKRLKGAFSSAKNKPQRLHALPKQSSNPKISQASSKTTTQEPKSLTQHADPTIPFKKNDRILLVGEGDLSYAASLVKAHGCTNVTATVFEKNFKELEEKYPHVCDNIAIVVPEDVDLLRTESSGKDGVIGEREAGSWETSEKENKQRIHQSLIANSEEAASGDASEDDTAETPRVGKVLYNIDAVKMGPFYDPIAKSQGRGKIGAFDHIAFMFPHVGGKSTDVNRQVRYNQELLVSFFRRSLPCLAPNGNICVTIFDGQPYELWCIRNLARHVGLAVEKSFRFQASAYPGYRHSRTLGVVKNKDGEVSEGAWKGEERAARTYVFRKQGELPAQPKVSKKRKGDPDLDDSDGD